MCMQYSTAYFLMCFDVFNWYLFITCTQLVQECISVQIDSYFFGRLSEQAQRHLHDGEKFEDIQLGLNRPTLVVMRYQELFSQGRVEAVDAIEALQFTGEMEDSGEEENKLFAAQYVLDALEVSPVMRKKWSNA